MRNYIMLLAISTSLLNGMDADWFYHEQCPYREANELYQQRKWQEAEAKYVQLLNHRAGDFRDQTLAAINLASCQMAQRKSLGNWTAYDRESGSAQDKKFSPRDDGALLLIRTDNIGIGDIAHFLPAVTHFRESAPSKLIFLAARAFMHPALKNSAVRLGVELVDEKNKEKVAMADQVTHLMTLVGHLNLRPEQLRPEEPLFTAEEKAVMRVKSTLDPKLKDDKQLAIVFVGENRIATLMGGKQLPRSMHVHGRQLNARAFEQLLQRVPQLILIDCNPSKSAITFNQEGEENLRMSADFKDRVVVLPAEEAPFDTTIALAHVMNVDRPRSIGFAADNGPANVFARALTKGAQHRFAYIIPNPEEYDARMEGDGESYTQMISECPVYKCQAPDKQAQTIGEAFDEIDRT